GTYTVTVTDMDGCIGTKSATASVEPLPAAVTSSTNANCGFADGSVDLTVTGGTSPFSYFWSSGHTTQDISVLYSGAYNVTVTDAKGCTVVSYGVISDNGGPSAVAAGVNASCYGTADADVNVTVTGGTTPYSYLWSNGATVEDLVNVADGIYSLAVTDFNGCKAYAAATLTEPDPFRVDFVQTNVLCNGQMNGAIDLTVSGGTTSYSYNWGGMVITQDRTGLGAGTYTVTVSDAGTCSSVNTFMITQPIVLTITATQDNNACNSDTRGAISLTVSGGTAPYTYLWSNSPASTTPYLSYLAAGTYTVTVTDRNGCTKSATYTITEPAQIQLSAVSTPTSCNGGANGSVDLTVTGGTSTITYQWSNGATTQDLSAVPAGTYTVFVADANNCTNSASYTVTEPSALAISATTQNVVCHGGTTGGVNITVSGGTPGYTYAWSNSSTTEDLSMIGIDDYSVTATDSKGCTIIGGAYSVTEPLLLNVDAVLTDVACNGTSAGAINITPFGGVSPYTYLWSNGAITQDISSIPAGTYTVTVTDNSSCTDVHTYTVIQPAALTLMLTGTNSTCNGSNDGMVVSSVGGGVTPYTYAWSSGQAASSISNRTPGTYGLTVTDDRGCQISGSKMLTEPAAIVITDAVQQVACNGGSTGAVDIGVTGGTSPYTYLWSNTATSQDLGSLRSLSYAVTITDSNGCVEDASYTVTEPAAISISAAVTNPLCNGGTNGSVNLTVTGGTPAGTAPFYTYAWSGGQTAEDPTGLSAGTYTVTVTDANLCTAVYSVNLSQPDALAVTTQQTNCSCDMVNDGALDLLVSGGTTPYTYSWTGGGGSNEDISGLAPATYDVTISDANSCQITRSYTITQPSALTASATSIDVACFGNTNGSVNLTAGGGTAGYAYFWSDGSTTEDLSSLGAGVYSVTVSDANNCTKTASATVSEPSLLGIGVAVTSVNCFGGSDGGVLAVPSGGTSPYSYVWSSGSAT
ncbi:MAG: beta strand repeat-containing protein, partial [Bacteroidota bacterium]